MSSTLNLAFLETVARHGDAVAFLVKRDDTWCSHSYNWALEHAQRTAFGLSSLGLERGSRLGVLAENRPEWATTDVGAMAAGHLVVPLYTTLLPDQVA
jgi:long-chain acyl-CoA synthetase